MPFDLSPGTALFLAAAILAAAFVRGYSGFGFAALAISAAGLVTNPVLVVPVVLLCEGLIALQQAHGVRGHIDWRRVAALAAGAAIGVPLGVQVLANVGVDTARAFIALYILAMCAVLLTGWRFVRPVGAAPHVGVGIFSGIANGAAVGGLPVAAFFAAQPISAATFRATLIAYFLLLDLWSMPLMWQAGMISGDTLRALVWSLPLAMLGSWLGGRHFLRAEPKDFRRFAIGLLAVLSLAGLAKSVI